MKQVVHIFRKDCRRLWLMICAVLLLIALHGYGEATIPSGSSGVAVGLSPYMVFYLLVVLSGVLLPIALLLLVVSVVQEESLVGSDQFWLTRPYHIGSLVLEKLLFVFVWAILPMFLHDVLLIRYFHLSLFSAASLLLWKHAQFALFLLIAAALAALSANFARFLLLAIGSIVMLLLAFYIVMQGGRETPSSESEAIYAGVASLAVVALGAACVLAYQYRYRRTGISKGLGLVFLFAAVLLIRFWPQKMTKYLSGRNVPPTLRSFQLRPDLDLKEIGHSSVDAVNTALSGVYMTFYPFQATGLPYDVGVVLEGFSAQFDSPGQKPTAVSSAAEVRFQSEADGRTRFIDAAGPNQLVPFIMVERGNFVRVKESEGTLSGEMHLDGYRTAVASVPVPPASERGRFAIAGRVCQVTSFPRESKLILSVECAELEPGNISRFQVRLLENNRVLLPEPSQPQANTAGSWPALLSPIRKTNYHWEFTVLKADMANPAEWANSAPHEMLVLAEETLGSVSCNFRI